MDQWVVKYWLPLLLVALVAAIYYEFRSVETVKLDAGNAVNDRINLQEQGPQNVLRTPEQTHVEKYRSSLAVGQRFHSLAELESNQRDAGFLRTGYFGKHWPATVTEIATGRHRISFIRQNGTRHTYNKFNGYDMKMVRLQNEGKETIIVFRSTEKLR